MGLTKMYPAQGWHEFDVIFNIMELTITGLMRFYRAMHFSAYARSWDRMSSVRPSVCDVGDL